jgi:hypothetical protein
MFNRRKQEGKMGMKKAYRKPTLVRHDRIADVSGLAKALSPAI